MRMFVYVLCLGLSTEPSFLGLLYNILFCEDLGKNPKRLHEPLTQDCKGDLSRSDQNAIAGFVQSPGRHMLCTLLLTLMRRRKLNVFRQRPAKMHGFERHARKCVAGILEVLR